MSEISSALDASVSLAIVAGLGVLVFAAGYFVGLKM